MGSVMVADPLRILDCSPITDGAAAAILCPLDMAEKMSSQSKPVRIAGVGHATNSVALHSRRDRHGSWRSVRISGRAGLRDGPAADRATIHDRRGPRLLHDRRDLRPSRRSASSRTARAAPRPRPDSRPSTARSPINTSGGLKSQGPPGGRHRHRADRRDRRSRSAATAGDRQVAGVTRGLAQNMGGSGGSSLVHILEAV